MRRLLRAIRSQIRYRIILPYLALTLVVMMAGAVIALALVAASQEERLTNQLSQIARGTTDALTNRESNHLVFLRQMAFAQENNATNAPAVADAIASGDQAAVSRALDNFYKFALLNPSLDFDRMIAFDDHGMALVDWLRVKEDPLAPPAVIEGTNLSQIPFVKQIIAGQFDENTDKFAGLIGFAPDPQPYFYTAAPVKQGDKIVGGLMVAMKADRLVVSLQRFSQAAVTTFYDLQGKAVGSTLLERPELSQFPVPAVVLSELGSGQPRSLFNYDIRQRPYELVYSRLEIAGKHVGYYAVGLSRDFQIESVSLSRNSIIAITMILALGSVLLGYRIARSITVPLTDLVDTAEAVTAGDLERRTPIQSSDELGRLGQAFNQMTEHLLRLYQTSRDLSTTIEVDSVLDIAASVVRSFAPDTEVLALLNERGVWRYSLRADALDRGTWQYRLRADAPDQIQVLRNLRFSLHDPLLQELATERAPRLFIAEDEPRLMAIGLTSLVGFTTVLMTPLVAQEKLAGVLIFGHTKPYAFEGAIGSTLIAAANMAASVLYNAVLFSQVQEDAGERNAILQSIGDGVVVCDHQRNIMLVNSAAEQMLNLHDWHLVWRNFSEVPLKRIEIEQEPFGREKAMLDYYQFGDRVLRLSSAPVISENGATLGEVIVIHDLNRPTQDMKDVIGLALREAQQAEDISAVSNYTTPVLLDTVYYFISPDLAAALTDLDNIAGVVRGYQVATSPVSQRNAIQQATDQLEALAQRLASLSEPFRPLFERVIGRWRLLLIEVSYLFAEPEGPIRNPYVFGNPVQGDLFVGREDVLRRLEELWMQSDQSPSVIIYGHRRMGKSSVLRNLSSRLGDQTIIVDFNMQRVGRVQHTGELLYNLALKLYDAYNDLGHHDLAEPEEVRFFAHNPYIAFDRFLIQLDSVRSGYRFIVTIDEFEYIEEQIDAGCLDSYLLEHWRSTFQTYPWLIMAFAGLHSLEEMRRDYWNPLFGSVTAVEVGFLSPDAIRRLITQPAPDFAIDYDVDAVEQIITLTNGQPYLVQLIGHSLVTRFNRQLFEERLKREQRFRAGDIEAVINIPEFYRDGNAYFSGVWIQAATSEPSGQTTILKMLSTGPMSLTDLANRTDSDPDQVRAALYTLRQHDVITQRDGLHMYSVELMRRWVAHQQFQQEIAH